VPVAGDEAFTANMDMAQADLEEAIRRVTDPTPEMIADFHMMQSLIHTNRGAAVEDDEERGRLYRESRVAQALAEEQNPDNPRAWMFRGFNRIRQDKSDEGRIMLSKALGKWDAYPAASAYYPDWGRRWIDFWMGGIEKRERQALPDTGQESDSL
jgi:hypothetical protein